MKNTTRKFIPKSARLMDQVREVLCFHHYAYNTEKSTISWILQYIRFHNKKTSRLVLACLNVCPCSSQVDLSICNMLDRISLLSNSRTRLSAC